MEYTHQFFTYCLIYGIVMFGKYIREDQEQKVRASQLEQQLTRARLQALQMKLHPHFLFNTFNMISSTTYENTKAADKIIANLSDLLRISLEAKGAEEHSLEKELEILNLYIAMMKARFQDKLIVETDIQDGTRETLVPGFILQPLVENAIKYSMKTLQTAEIKILSQKEAGRLRLIIEENGPGISEETNQIFKNGMCLSNTVERIEKLYRNNHQLQSHNQDKAGLRVVMKIPFKKAISTK